MHRFIYFLIIPLVFPFIFDHYAEGADERAKLKDMEKIAEGGIEFLMEQRLAGEIPDIAKVIQLIREAQPATT